MSYIQKKSKQNEFGLFYSLCFNSATLCRECKYNLLNRSYRKTTREHEKTTCERSFHELNFLGEIKEKSQ